MVEVKVKAIVQEAYDAARGGYVTVDVLDHQMVTAPQEMTSKPGWPRLMGKDQQPRSTESGALVV